MSIGWRNSLREFHMDFLRTTAIDAPDSCADFPGFATPSRISAFNSINDSRDDVCQEGLFETLP